MGALGNIFGGFMQGYQNTLLQRHAERERQFTQYMDAAKTYRGWADQEKQKPVWNQALVTEAETNAQKYEAMAEKAINQKIGGLAKLGSMIKGMGGGKGVGALGQGQQTSQAAPTSDTSGVGMPPSASGPGPESVGGMQEAPPQSPGASLSPGLPAAPAAQPSEEAPPQEAPKSSAYDMSSLPAPPGQQPSGPVAAPAPAPSISVAAAQTAPAEKTGPIGQEDLGLPKGYSVNPLYATQQRMILTAEQAKNKMLTHDQIEKADAMHKQQKQYADEDAAEIQKTPGWDQLSPAQQVQALAEIKTGRSLGLLQNYAGRIARTTKNVKDEDGLYDYHYDMFGNFVGKTPSGQTAGQINMSARYQQAVDVFKKANPQASDDEANQAVAGAQSGILQNRAALLKLQLVREQDLIDIGKQQFQWKKDAEALKKTGTMSSAQALETIRHYDNMAQFELFGDPLNKVRLTQGKTGDEVAEMIVERSKALLAASGFNRDDLMKTSTGKTPPSVEQQTQNAVKSLTAPPGTTKKTGTIKPPG